jgi:DNA mismatch repair protein MutS
MPRRRNLEITQNLAGGTDNTLASVLDCTVTPMGSRMLKRWLHMPVRDTAVLVERQQTIGALQERYRAAAGAARSAIWNVFWRVWRCAPPVRDLRASSPASSCASAARLADVDSQRCRNCAWASLANCANC